MDIQGKIPAVLLTRHRTVRHKVWLKINKTPFTCQLFGRNAAVTAEAESDTFTPRQLSADGKVEVAEEMLSFQVMYITLYISSSCVFFTCFISAVVQ